MNNYIIRKKFKGRNKKDNNVSVDSIVLVGIRTWEVLSGNKKPKVDLLYAYSPSQVDDLVKDKLIGEIIYPDSVSKEEQDDGIEFDRNAFFHDEVSNKETDTETNIKLVMPNTTSTSSSPKKTADAEEINWDDI